MVSAQALNLVPHFTPVRSPQSSGMSKAFVKILKRDYTHLAFPKLTSTELDGWIEVYNGIHRRLAQKVASPRELICINS